MSRTQAFINGKWVDESELSISIHDTGFVLGATATEQLRTFRTALFQLDSHLDRLWRSLDLMGIDPGYSRHELADIAARVVAHNHPLGNPAGDLGLGIFVTPGLYPSFSTGTDPGPTVCLYSYPLPFAQWARKYRSGAAVVVSDVAQVPPQSWPPELKCRSRMHYYLADRQAAAVDPGARALLLDAEGHVCEASTANVLIYRDAEGLVSPPIERVLPGVSLTTVASLAARLAIPVRQRDISRDELAAADELLLTSTPFCLLPVVRCDGQTVGSGGPGPIYRQLLAAWSDLVGVDIEAQAERMATRP